MKEIIRTAPLCPLRAALYVRVSEQEQAIRGLSLEAQQEDLEEYARSQGWVIVGVYIDAAKTARKRLGKRTNFLRMLEDVKKDKVDLILFTRLDRWFRGKLLQGHGNSGSLQLRLDDNAGTVRHHHGGRTAVY